MLLRAILSAVIGTVAMTLSSTTEMQWVERPASVVPRLATAKLLRPFGIREVKGSRALDILATWTHWGYGILWGVVFWALIGPAGLPLAAAGGLFFLIVWGTEQIQLPVLQLAPWPWRWGLKSNAIDAWHHAVYAAGTVTGWILLGHVG
jgi:hypothetical protein